jgi:hypothetical protein
MLHTQTPHPNPIQSNRLMQYSFIPHLVHTKCTTVGEQQRRARSSVTKKPRHYTHTQTHGRLERGDELSASDTKTIGRVLRYVHRKCEWGRLSHLSASRTSGNKCIASSLFLEPVGCRGNKSDARGSEGMANGERPTPSVELLDGNLSNLHNKWIKKSTITTIRLRISCERRYC